ncbi:hypothetical protein GUJ93_ZPchr0012g21161 [Zizania palustris]|uniref:Uncharacterized protein n=1 Tax=Zizania palustris TaxID=103762 RepID=A0A8J5WJU8_ZIZPA|nr:hypothetical protein GUJ93_ZPchr0012g21161 [Zizania palustris]
MCCPMVQRRSQHYTLPLPATNPRTAISEWHAPHQATTTVVEFFFERKRESRLLELKGSEKDHEVLTEAGELRKKRRGGAKADRGGPKQRRKNIWS